MDQLDHNSKEDMPQFLQDLRNKDAGYRIPNDYFAKMQANVLDQVIKKESVKDTVLIDNIKSWFQELLQPQYALIGLAAIVLIGVLIGNGNNSSGDINSFATLEDVDLEYFMENEIDDINHQDLMATLSADEFNYDDFTIPISSDGALNTIPDDYIDDLDNTALIEFEIED